MGVLIQVSATMNRVLPLRTALVAAMLAIALAVGGCAHGPKLLPADEQRTIDRAQVEYPAAFELKLHVVNLTAPTAIAFDSRGTMFVAEGGVDGREPRILGWHPDGREFTVYPTGRRVPLFKTGFQIYGPIGGMAVADGTIYVSHRDANGRGVITAFDYEGNHRTVVADLPAQGDHGVTDIAIHPITGRLFFGVGTATNSGVVGIDNWQRGWLRRHPDVHDVPYVDLKLHGRRFDTPNPFSGLFGGQDVAVTAPFLPFGVSNQTTIRKAHNGKPNGALYSIDPGGGDLRVEAHGLRHPRGLAFNVNGRLYLTNNGMELRGSRPVKNDPDVLLWWVRDTWYGWPDYSADLYPISEERPGEDRFQPPPHLILPTGYPDLSFLIDHEASGLLRPSREILLAATFPPLSGAAKFAFAPSSGAWRAYADNAIVALDGDRAPFATGGPRGLKLARPVGYRVVRVDMDTRQVSDFIYNTMGAPGSRTRSPDALERPIDVEFHPADGSLYILDFGQMEMRDGKPRIMPRSGRVLRLVPLALQPPRELDAPTYNTQEDW